MKYVIDRLTIYLNEWEDSGFISITNKKLFQAAAAALHKRGAPTTFIWIKGHSGEEGNKRANKLADEGVRKDVLDEPDVSINPAFSLTRVTLFKLTQATTYVRICELRQTKSRQGTTGLLNMI